jgi:hypothetical protein
VSGFYERSRQLRQGGRKSSDCFHLRVVLSSRHEHVVAVSEFHSMHRFSERYVLACASSQLNVLNPGQAREALEAFGRNSWAAGVRQVGNLPVFRIACRRWRVGLGGLLVKGD